MNEIINQDKILYTIKKGLKYRKNYTMFITNKGVNFKTDIWVNVYLEFTSTQNCCNCMIIIFSKMWCNFEIKEKENK